MSTDIVALAGLRSNPYVDKHVTNNTAGLRRVPVICMNLEYQVSTLV